MKTAPPPYLLVEYYPHMLQVKGTKTSKFLGIITSYGYRIYDCQQQV